MRKAILFAAASGLGLSFSGSANAAVSYQYIPAQAQYTVAAGTQVVVNIYLLETLTQGSQSILAAGNQNGLSGAAFKLAKASSNEATPAIIAGATFDSDAATNQFNGANFNTKTLAADGSTLTLSESNFFSAPGTGVQLGNTPSLAITNGITTPANEVFLGSVTLTAGSGGTTVFNLGSSGLGGSTVTNNDTLDLDSNNATTPVFTGVGNALSTISITVPVPEPTSIGLAGVVSTLGLLARRRKVCE